MDRIHQRPKSKTRRDSVAGQAERDGNLLGSRQVPLVCKAAALLAVVVVTFLIYSPALKSPFLFDDDHNIGENRHIRLTKLALKDIIAAGFKSPAAHRPVANISFALNYYFHKYNVVGYHCTNVIIHILTAIFFYLFAETTLGLSPSRRGHARATEIAFFAAVLWLVHPLQTQSVTYIVQRMTSLAAMFYILSFLLYVKGRLSMRAKRRNWPWFAACIFAGILAVACKQIAATLPLFILLYEWYFFQDLNRAWLKRGLICLLGVFILLGLLGFWYLGLRPWETILSGYGRRYFSLAERLLSQPRALIYYLSLLTYPHPGRLNLDHDFPPSHSLIDPATTLPSLVVIVALIGLALYLVRRRRLLSFCILWFLGNLVIESSVVPLELVFEHRLYLPSMLVCLAAVVLASHYIKQSRLRVAVLSIAVLLCCVGTYARNRVWADPITLWRDSAAKSPKKPRPHNSLANVLLKAGKTYEAIEHFEISLGLKPDSAAVHNNLGNALDQLEKTEEAIKHYRKALELRPDFAEVHYNLAMSLAIQGHDKEAIAEFYEAIRLKPDCVEALTNLGYALAEQGKFTDAVLYYRRALELAPGNVITHCRLGLALAGLRRFDQAIEQLRIVLRYRPDDVETLYNLGLLLEGQGKTEEAIQQYRRVLQVNPKDIKARQCLEAALAKLRS